jgi:hypothetical protein
MCNTKVLRLSKLATLVGLLFLLGLPLLQACGDGSTPTPTVQSVRGATPIPNFTPTPMPTPTPTQPPIKANKLILGSVNDRWGEIVRYVPSSGDTREEVTLNLGLLENVGSWFDYAPTLVSSNAKTAASQRLYKFTLRQDLKKGLIDGSLKKMPALEASVWSVVADGGTNLGVLPPAPIAGMQDPAPGVVFQVAVFLIAQDFFPEIDGQIGASYQSLEDFKMLLQGGEYITLSDNLDYLIGVRDALKKQSFSEADVQAFRNRLESLEKESVQVLRQAKLQMDRSFVTYRDTRIDKLGVLRDEQKIDDFFKLIDDYKYASANYYNTLLLRGLAAQLACALPGGQIAGMNRLKDVDSSLSIWYGSEIKFYDLINARTQEMDGWLATTEKQDRFKTIARNGKAVATQAYSQVNGTLTATSQQSKAQKQAMDQPLSLVVELDEQDKVTKVSKL